MKCYYFYSQICERRRLPINISQNWTVGHGKSLKVLSNTPRGRSVPNGTVRKKMVSPRTQILLFREIQVSGTSLFMYTKLYLDDESY